LVGWTAADLQAQMSGEGQEPETDEDKFVDAARHGRFQEVRDLHEKGVDPDYYNDATVSQHTTSVLVPQPASHRLVCDTLLTADARRRARATLPSTGPP
jgi:hypothetical protein